MWSEGDFRHRNEKKNSLIVHEFFHNYRLIRQSQPKQIMINSETCPEIEPRSLALLTAIRTTTLECFLCLCEAVIESYLCMGNSVQFI